MEQKKIFIICSVRNATEEYRDMLERYSRLREAEGYQVHLPHRDTCQDHDGYTICMDNKNAILDADEIHVFYSDTSQGTHFDMGIAFALEKPIIVVDNVPVYTEHSFPQVLREWQTRSRV